MSGTMPAARTRVSSMPVVAAAGLHVPDGAGLAAELSGWLPEDAATAVTRALAGACAPAQAAEVLGRKGLLYKDDATRLALCAVHRALGFPPGHRERGDADPATAVVVAANLGNLSTVAGVVHTVRAGSGRDVSPLAAPNASSNVIASTVALWFRFGGPNLMICSGATAGLDAVRAARLLLLGGRARRVVVVGVEAADETAAAVHRFRLPRAALRTAAACLVLTAPDETPGTVRIDAGRIADPADPSHRLLGAGGFDLTDRWGPTYGAEGVVATALAVTLAVARAGPVRVVCGDDIDGRTAVLVRGEEEHR